MDYRLPLEQFSHRVQQHPHKPWLHQPVAGQWRSWSWQAADQEARRIASGLVARYGPGERIAILSKNCAEWFLADLAIAMAGMVSVPIYATAGKDTIGYVLEHSGARAIFLGKLDNPTWADQAVPAGILRVALPYPTARCDEQWADWLDSCQPLARLPDYGADDLFTLVYTSGSTGQPKGVVLSHGNVGASSATTAAQTEWRDDDRCISYLPLAHITERCVLELMSYYAGPAVYFVESLDTFVDDIKHARPSFFISVPRLWTKFQSGILAKIPDRKLQRLLGIPLLGRLLARKIRAGLGLDQCRVFGSGSAPIAPDLLRWYARLGMPIAEGWGMTETAGLSCSNLPYREQRLGTIGQPVACVEMRLGEDEEVQIRGPAVFRAYYNNPQATAEAFVDGWFRTGDRGARTADGGWKIVGRLKEQFKTAKGKYVAPAPIENLLARDEFVEQVCVLGSGQPQPSALVVLSERGSRASRAQVQQALQLLLEQVNGELEAHQRLAQLIVLPEAFDVDNGLLTPTLKIRRGPIEEKFGGLLGALGEAEVVWA